MRRLAIASLAIVLPLGACSDSDPAADTGGATTGGADDDGATTAPATDESTGATEQPVDGPTFYEDVLPIVIAECAGCHTPGGIGPFDLTDYETAKGLSGALAVVTESRTMPPFNANNEGICNTFQDARWLAHEQIDLFREWAETGAQEGDPSTPQPEPPTLPPLVGRDIAEHPMPQNYLPVADSSSELGVDDYQCFLVDLEVGDAPRYLTGYEVLPGNPAVTHHLVGFLVDTNGAGALGNNGDLIQLLDDASPDQPGWDCFGAAGNGIGVEGTPVTWAPGGGAFNFPEGTGIRIDPGYVLVAQMHYNLANGISEDSTTLRLSWADEVEREAVNALQDRFLIAGFNGGIEIPPGEESYVYQWDDLVRNFSGRIGTWNQVEILGVLPHMHSLGTRMQVDFFTGPDNEEKCGLYVDRWDYQWQQGFMYEEPFILDPGDTVRVTCEWDTTGKDAPTTPGLGTQNEMCLLGLYAAEVK